MPFFYLLPALGAIAADKIEEIPRNVTKAQIIQNGNYNEILGWIRKRNDFLCGGYYEEASDIIKYPQPLPVMDAPVEVISHSPAYFKQSGESLLHGGVILKQPGRELFADRIEFFRDHETGKIKHADLFGDVRFSEHGKLLISTKGKLDFSQKKYHATDGIYRLLADTSAGLVNVWGRAKEIYSEESGILRCKKATYSTCPPDVTPWYIWSNTLILDRNENRGVASNAIFYVRKVPVFYMPYFSFSLDRKRKSGFLTPAPTYSSKSGYSIDFPYYLNLASNYDFTLAPEIFAKRGLFTSGKFRYLTTHNQGHAQVSYIPRDRAFRNFRDTALFSYDQRALKALRDSKDFRGSLGLENRLTFNDHWLASLDVNYVTDDYFIQDFPGIHRVVDSDQLLNRLDVSYTDEHWYFLSRLQLFQTLHPITHGKTQEQYRRLPQLNFAGEFPNFYSGFDYHFDSEIVNFSHGKKGYYDRTVVDGARLALAQTISKPLHWKGGAFIPRVELQGIGYGLYDRIHSGISGVPSSVARIYPIFSLDGNFAFSREIYFFGSHYKQTLEPRLFYLLVPHRDQNEVPIFDTYLPPFDFSQLFRSNRFLGVDRIGDANQLAVALTSRFLDEKGHECFSASIGQLLAFKKHSVFIEDHSSAFIPFNPDPLGNEHLSPIVGRIQYNMGAQLNGSMDIAWDPSYHRINTANFNLQYKRDHGHVLNLWYNYVLQGDQLQHSESINLSRIGVSFYWQVWRNWSFMGNLNYNTSYGRAQSHFCGLEYNGCCWGMRIGYGRNFIGIGSNDQKNYDSRYYIQILFKGFSDVAFGSIHNLLAEQVRGFEDNFSKR